jgi:thioredoxin-dependent peroxiredoxin
MKTTILRTKTIATLILAVLAISIQSFTIKKNKDKMKIKAPQAAPNFNIKDISGNVINLSDYKGKKVLLSFYRNVGCPICNLRFHELQQETDYFKSKNLVVLAVYESTPENMRTYLEGQSVYASMLPNPEQSLYSLYQIDRGMGKMMKGMFHSAMGKMKQGKKLFKTKVKQDGNSDRIGADFLIDENGNIHTAFYGNYVGDHLPLADIKKFLN